MSNAENKSQFLPHSRCSPELRTRIDRVAEAVGIKPSKFVRQCVKYTLGVIEEIGTASGFFPGQDEQVREEEE